MKRFRLKRRVVVDGTLNKRALNKADTTPVALPAGGRNLTPEITPDIPPKSSAPAPKEVGNKGAAPAPSPLDKLNPKQVAFIAHYMVSANATAAATAAGYSAATAYAQGSELLNHPEVSRVMENIKQQALAAAGVSRAQIIAELKALALANMGDYMRAGDEGQPVLDFSNLTRAQTAALREVTVEEFKDGRSDKRQVRRIKFKMYDKAQALELLGRAEQMFAEKVDHRHTHEGAIGLLLQEIDEAGRRRKTIDVTPQGD